MVEQEEIDDLLGGLENDLAAYRKLEEDRRAVYGRIEDRVGRLRALYQEPAPEAASAEASAEVAEPVAPTEPAPEASVTVEAAPTEPAPAEAPLQAEPPAEVPAQPEPVPQPAEPTAAPPTEGS